MRWSSRSLRWLWLRTGTNPGPLTWLLSFTPPLQTRFGLNVRRSLYVPAAPGAFVGMGCRRVGAWIDDEKSEVRSRDVAEGLVRLLEREIVTKYGVLIPSCVILRNELQLFLHCRGFTSFSI